MADDTVTFKQVINRAELEITFSALEECLTYGIRSSPLCPGLAVAHHTETRGLESVESYRNEEKPLVLNYRLGAL